MKLDTKLLNATGSDPEDMRRKPRYILPGKSTYRATLAAALGRVFLEEGVINGDFSKA